MALFNKFFKKSSADDKVVLPDVEFGRYLSCNKSPSIYRKYNESIRLFDAGKYNESIDVLMDYLNDSSQENIVSGKFSNQQQYKILQGIQKVHLEIIDDEISIYTRLGRYEQLNPSLFRYILSKNYNFHYSCYAIDNSEIILKSNSKIRETSPEKLFFVLKEVAMNSASDSESFIKEFNLIPNIDKPLIPEKFSNVKIKYLKLWITETLDIIGKMDQEKDLVIISYYLLTLLFRIDFLLAPEGEVKLLLNKSLISYNQKNLSSTSRFDSIKSYLNEVLQLPSNDLINSFVKYKYTFSIIEASSHKLVYEFILKQLDENTKLTSRPSDKSYSDCLNEYIIGYCMYYFGVYPATKKLITLIYNLLYPEFFREMGFVNNFYDEKLNSLNKVEIENEIKRIINDERKDYPHLGIVSVNLNYNSLPSFCRSLLNEITYLNFTQPEI